MPQITDIKPQKKPGRFNIFLDEKYAFSLPAETLLGLRSHFGEGGVKASLAIGQTLSQEEIEKLTKEDDFIKVYDRVLKFFSYRPRSKKELSDWFKRKEVGEETQKLVSKKMEGLGLVNDTEFARWWVEQRKIYHPSGFRLLKMELKQKGISEEIISGIESQASNVSELEIAKKIVEKKMKSLKSPKTLNEQAFKQKLIGVLARRGFSWDIIKEVIDDLFKKE